MEFHRGIFKVRCVLSSKYLTISLSYTLSINYWSFVYSWLRSWISLCTWLGFVCDFLKVIHTAYQSSTACGSNIQPFKAHWLPMTWLEDLLWTHHQWVRSFTEQVPRANLDIHNVCCSLVVTPPMGTLIIRASTKRTGLNNTYLLWPHHRWHLSRFYCFGPEVQKGNIPKPIRRVSELSSKTLREVERDVKTRPRIAIQGVW